MEQANNTWNKGLQMDTHPMMQGNDSMTDCLNGTLISMNGNEVILQNDMGNRRIDHAFLPSGYEPVGIKEHGGIIYVASYNPITNKSQIGSFPSPERIIDYHDDENLNSSFDFYKFYNEGESTNVIDKDGKEKSINYIIKSFYLIPLTKDSINVGDKFSIYSADLYTTANTTDPTKQLSLSNYFNTTEDGKITSPKNGQYTIQVGVLNQQNNFQDITHLLKRWDINSNVLNLDSLNFTSNYIFNSGYFISKEYTSQNHSKAISDAELIACRNKEAANTYAYKTSGPLYLKIIYNMPIAFNYTFNGQVIDNVLSLKIKGTIKYNCPDGITKESGRGDEDYEDYMDNQEPSKIDFTLFNQTLDYSKYLLSYDEFQEQNTLEDFLKIPENYQAYKTQATNWKQLYEDTYNAAIDSALPEYIDKTWETYTHNGRLSGDLIYALQEVYNGDYFSTLKNKIKSYTFDNKSIFKNYQTTTYIDPTEPYKQEFLFQILQLFSCVPEITNKKGGDLKIIDNNIQYIDWAVFPEYSAWIKLLFDKGYYSTDDEVTWVQNDALAPHENQLSNIYEFFGYNTDKQTLDEYKEIYEPYIYNLFSLYSQYVYSSEFTDLTTFIKEYEYSYNNKIDEWISNYWLSYDILEALFNELEVKEYDSLGSTRDTSFYMHIVSKFDNLHEYFDENTRSLGNKNDVKDFIYQFKNNEGENLTNVYDTIYEQYCNIQYEEVSDNVGLIFNTHKSIVYFIIYLLKNNYTLSDYKWNDVPINDSTRQYITVLIEYYKKVLARDSSFSIELKNKVKATLLSYNVEYNVYTEKQSLQDLNIQTAKVFEWFTSKEQLSNGNQSFYLYIREELARALEKNENGAAVELKAIEKANLTYPKSKPYIEWLTSKYQEYKNNSSQTILTYEEPTTEKLTQYHKDDNYYYATIDKNYKFNLGNNTNSTLSGTLEVLGGSTIEENKTEQNETKYETKYYYIKDLTSNFSLNLANLNSGDINLISYKFYNWYSEQQTKLLLQFEVYPREGEQFKNLRINFEKYSNSDDSTALVQYLSFSDSIQNGINIISFDWAATQIKTTSYAWIKFSYAQSPDLIASSNITDSPYYEGVLCKYIGIAYNKEIITESDNPLDYTWITLYEAINAGIEVKDADTTYYTWIKFSDGSSLTDSPEGALYVGIATNQGESQKSDSYNVYNWKSLGTTEGADTSIISNSALLENTIYKVSFEYDSYYNQNIVHNTLPTQDYWFLTTELFNDLYSNDAIQNYCTTTDSAFIDKLTISPIISELNYDIGNYGNVSIIGNLLVPESTEKAKLTFSQEVEIKVNSINGYVDKTLYPSELDLPSNVVLDASGGINVEDGVRITHIIKETFEGTPDSDSIIINYPTKKDSLQNLVTSGKKVNIYILQEDTSGAQDFFRLSWSTIEGQSWHDAYRATYHIPMNDGEYTGSRNFYIHHGSHPISDSSFQTKLNTIMTDLRYDSGIYNVNFYCSSGTNFKSPITSYICMQAGESDPSWILVNKSILNTQIEYVWTSSTEISNLHKLVFSDEDTTIKNIKTTIPINYTWVGGSNTQSTYGFGNLMFNTNFKSGTVNVTYLISNKYIIAEYFRYRNTASFNFVNSKDGIKSAITDARQVLVNNVESKSLKNNGSGQIYATTTGNPKLTFIGRARDNENADLYAEVSTI